MSRTRVAALAAASVAMLGTAQAAPAASLNVDLPSLSGQGNTGRLGARVETPVAEADVQVSSGRIAASVTTSDPSVEMPQPATPKPRGKAAATGASSGPKAGRTQPSGKEQRIRPSASERSAAPARAPRAMPTMDKHARELPARSFLPEWAFSADGSVASAVPGSTAATAALAGFLLVGIAFLSWITRPWARTLSAPLLSFALQRPG